MQTQKRNGQLNASGIMQTQKRNGQLNASGIMQTRKRNGQLNAKAMKQTQQRNRPKNASGIMQTQKRNGQLKGNVIGRVLNVLAWRRECGTGRLSVPCKTRDHLIYDLWQNQRGHRKRTTDKVIQRYVNVDVVTCTVSRKLSRVCI